MTSELVIRSLISADLALEVHPATPGTKRVNTSRRHTTAVSIPTTAAGWLLLAAEVHSSHPPMFRGAFSSHVYFRIHQLRYAQAASNLSARCQPSQWRAIHSAARATSTSTQLSANRLACPTQS